MRMARSCLALLALLTVVAAWTGEAHSAPPPVVQASQRLATLLVSHEAFADPAQDSARLALVAARGPLTGERTVLPVLGKKTEAGGIVWLHVMLPGRPNGRRGWIMQTKTVASNTRWHLVVDLSARRVVVYLGGYPVRSFPAVVGKPSTPTPQGRFFVEESVKLGPDDVGAPYALALSARSNVLQEFDGGPGQIALHGLDNVGGTLGTAASHGCIRLADATVTWLAGRVGPGATVTVIG
jgi:lipoprotein-anchoring transpeptidase ErfK/SrfK